MGLIVNMKLRRQRKAREALKAKIETELKAIQAFRGYHRAFADKCPKGDAFCHYRESIKQASLALAEAEKLALERLNAMAGS